MNNYLLVFLLVFAAGGLFAEDFKAIDGKEYKNVTVSRVEPDGIVLTSSSGISKAYFTELPKEVQERFHYDQGKSAAYSAEQAAAQDAFQRQQEEVQAKLAEESNKYWIDRESAKNQQAKKKEAHKLKRIMPVESGQQAQLQRERDLLTTRMESTTDQAEYNALHSQFKELQSHMDGMQVVPPPFREGPDEGEAMLPIGAPVPLSSAEWKAILQDSTQSQKLDKYRLISSLSFTTEQMENRSKELIEPKERVRARMTRMLLTWYHMQLYHSLPNDAGWDTTVFESKRHEMAIQIKRFQTDSSNNAVQDSWVNLLSVCNALGYPEASLP